MTGFRSNKTGNIRASWSLCLFQTMRSHSENVLGTHYRFYVVLAFHTKTLDFNQRENITTTLFAMRQILLNHATLGFSPIFYYEHDMGRDIVLFS